MTHAIALTRSGPTGGGLDTELEHVSLGVDDSSGGKRPKRFAIAAAALALGATAFVVADPLDSRSGQSVESVVEAPVAAGDLAPGSMYHVVDQIGARALWERGITGAGVNVAVIDTGATPVESLSGDGKIVAVADLSAEAASPSTAFVDGNGHGTHLAAIIAGREPGASPADSAAHPETFLGVAPDSGIVSVKVADRAGDTRQADVIAGIDWVVENSADLDIQVINLAFDSGSPLDYTSDALSAAVERAWNAGITVVVAAGNNGDETVGLASPANNPFVIAVGGALTGDELGVAEWSAIGDGVRNPDVVAPGVSIESARVAGSDADVNHGSTGYVDDETFKGTGSSQSAAVTAGLVALLLEAHPEWTPDEVKAALTRSATPIPGVEVERAGAGVIDAAGALTADVTEATQRFAAATQPADVPSVAAIQDLAPGTEWAGAHWAGAHWAG
ncbi:MAG: S8 family serine peptidase, partial [Ilumatobacteraceae bacterium]|nr:S8 family serine peptidase [Ilumatobacteraceae bacterium]